MTGLTAVGLDVGGSKIRGVRLDAADVVVEETVEPLAAGGAAQLDQVMSIARRLMDATTAHVGIGMAGLVSAETGRFVWGPHLDGTDMDVAGQLSTHLGIDVVVDNDANMAAVGEHALGAGRGHRHVVVITLGTGIGAGIVIDGAVYRGRSFAGEVGHITLRQGGGRCACGREGCWETLVSGRVFDRAAVRLAAGDPAGAVARRAGGETPTGVHLAAAAMQGDEASLEVVLDVGRRLGEGLALLTMVLDPDCYVLGGAAGVGLAGLLIPAAVEEMASLVEGAGYRERTPVVPAGLGAASAAVGAAIASRKHTNV